MQLKTTMQYKFTPARMTIIKKTSAGKDVEKLEPSYTVSGNIKWYSYCGKQFGN